MDYMITDNQGNRIKVLLNPSLDIAYGSGENDFELTVDTHEAAIISGSCLLVSENSDIGGIIDTVTDDNNQIIYSGRSWHGILAGKIIQPPTGQDYYTVNGAFRTIIEQLITRLGLTSLFTTDMTCPHTINGTYQFARYTDAYTGLLDMCQANNLTLLLTYKSDMKKVLISTRPQKSINNLAVANAFGMKITRNYNRVNHAIGLGKGELKNRTVVHWYADTNGKISTTQTLTGNLENTIVYENTNAEPDELNDTTRKKLEEYQALGTINADMSDTSIHLDIGDKVTAISQQAHLTVTNYVTKKVITIEGDTTNIEYTLNQTLHDTTQQIN
ncbi:hypothetical protein EJ419_07355 [Alloscardovia theropitheci]|uniref:Uncharacterized protein n=1 Tax=Alloscardovia theropitheci TaxID=2496842 RepID=A0A4R0QRU1_9BIFI|nr:hypothetical protein [Alloscardovia theropitheci]TCD53775.1 hypothetical protein EJ419_07355 [Alloscardovia theropitheci]